MSLRRITRLAVLLAIAVVLGYVESFLPSFLPGVKLGFANVVILLVLVFYSWWEAMIVSILRVFLVSLLCGSLFQLGFYTSLSGAVVSLLIMSLLILLKDRLSIITVSIVGSFFHVFAQVVAVFCLTSFNKGTFFYLPHLLAFSIPTGAAIGAVVRLLKDSPIKGLMESGK